MVCWLISHDAREVQKWLLPRESFPPSPQMAGSIVTPLEEPGMVEDRFLSA